jgi:RNA polymerase sigma factor (sigma-70 family)
MFFLRGSKKRSETTDTELISQYKETGESACVGELFERYTGLIYGVCRKYLKGDEESRDAAMEIFEYLLVELKKYEIHNFKSWLGQATRNFCLMRLRKAASVNEKVEEFKKSEAGLMESLPEPHLNGESSKEVELQKLEAALGTLNPAQKQCVELFFLQGKSYQEVVTATGFTMLEVKSYIQNGKRNLKLRMTESDG